MQLRNIHIIDYRMALLLDFALRHSQSKSVFYFYFGIANGFRQIPDDSQLKQRCSACAEDFRRFDLARLQWLVPLGFCPTSLLKYLYKIYGIIIHF